MKTLLLILLSAATACNSLSFSEAASPAGKEAACKANAENKALAYSEYIIIV